MAVIVAVIAAFIVGALWYSPALFGKYWMQLMGLNSEWMQNNKGAKKAYIGNIVGTVIMALVVAVLFSYADVTTPLKAISAAILIWAGIVMPFGYNEVAFGKKPRALWFLNGGHQLVTLIVLSYIIAIWH